MFERLFDSSRVWRLIERISRRSSVILIAALILTAVSTVAAARIQLDSNLVALLPAETASVQNLKRLVAKTGGLGDLMVMIESPAPERSLRYARDLLPKLRRLHWVERAEYGRDTRFLERNQLLYMDLADLEQVHRRVTTRIREEKAARHPLYVDLGEPRTSLDFSALEAKYRGERGRRHYQSADGEVLILVIKPRGLTSDLSFGRQIYAEVRRLVGEQAPRRYHQRMRVSIGGTFKNRLDEYDTIVGDLRTTALLGGLGIFLIITLYFRNPLAIVLIGVPLGMSLAWTFAAAYLVIGSLNIITAFLFLILFGLSIDFGIHMLARYQRERALGSSIQAALTAALHRAGRASLTAAGTSAAAFFALTVTRFRGFSEFGFIAGVGLLMAAAAFIVVFPALLVLAERLRLLRSGGWRERGPTETRLRSPTTLVAICAAVTMASVIFLPRLGFEYDLGLLRSQVSATREFNRKMRRVFSRARDPAVIQVEGPRQAAAVTAALQRRIDRAGRAGLLAEVKSIWSLIPADQGRKLALLHDLRRQIDRNLDQLSARARERVERWRSKMDLAPLAVEDLPAALTRPFLGQPGSQGQLVYVFQRRSLLDLREAVKFAAELSELRAGGRRYHPVSEPLVFAEMFEVLRQDTPIALGITLAVLLVLVFLDVRSLRATALVLSPLFIGISWMLGCVAAVDVKLNILNLVVLPTVMGLGVDAGIHLYHRYRELGRHGLLGVLWTTGSAVTLCTLTTMVGFCGMIMAQHPGLRSIGVLAVTGLGACLICALLLLPGALALWPPRRRLQSDRAKKKLFAPN